MTSIYIGAIIVLGLAALLFFRTSPGENLVNKLKPKPDLGNPDEWIIGPNVNGENLSSNMPLHPDPGFIIDLARPECQPHYVTADYGALTGKTQIIMTGRIEGGPVFYRDGISAATLCLYFQRRFDDWRATESDPPRLSDTETFRWFSTDTAILKLVNGPFRITADFAKKWTALQYSDSLTKPDAFKAAMDAAGEVGFVLGGFSSDGSGGWGHGIMAPNGARIIVESYKII